MAHIDEQGRLEPPLAAGEIESLIGFLDYQRATMQWKCSGVDAAGMQARVGVSSMTLGGLLKHMNYVEDHWFGRSLRGLDPAPPWDTVDWDADRDWEWNSAAHDTPEDLLSSWTAAVERSRRLLDEALTDGNLDQLASRGWPSGDTPSLRWILLHMIEEYARHNGHADLLREVADGSTGE
jgi:uncharacterized damage-inducible protein DinB